MSTSVSDMIHRIDAVFETSQSSTVADILHDLSLSQISSDDDDDSSIIDGISSDVHNGMCAHCKVSAQSPKDHSPNKSTITLPTMPKKVQTPIFIPDIFTLLLRFLWNRQIVHHIFTIYLIFNYLIFNVKILFSHINCWFFAFCHFHIAKLF